MKRVEAILKRFPDLALVMFQTNVSGERLIPFSSLEQRGAEIAAERPALYDRIAMLTGPLQVLDREGVRRASRESQRTTLAWARALEHAGKFDEALVLVGDVTDPSLATEVAGERAAVLLAGAAAAAQRADYATAVSRVQTLLSGSAPAPDSARAAALLRSLVSRPG